LFAILPDLNLWYENNQGFLVSKTNLLVIYYV